MSAVAEKIQVTPEDLLKLPNKKSFELINGELVERNVSVLSSWIGCTLSRLIGNHVGENHLGWVFGADNRCQCFPNLPNTVRKPDISYVKAERMGEDQIGDGWLRLVPDLIVEVISPDDFWEEVEEKIELFRRAGVPLIWVVSPTARNVRILRSDGSRSVVGDGEELSGENVVPGFACPVASIFPRKAPIVGDSPKP